MDSLTYQGEATLREEKVYGGESKYFLDLNLRLSVFAHGGGWVEAKYTFPLQERQYETLVEKLKKATKEHGRPTIWVKEGRLELNFLGL